MEGNSDDDRFTVWQYTEKCLRKFSWVDQLVELDTGTPSEVLECLAELGSPSSLKYRFNFAMDICVFRSDVVPMWEDNGHAGNGRLKFVTSCETEIDAIWIRTLMMLFYRPDLRSVSGVYLQIRRTSFNISLWFNEPGKFDRQGKTYEEIIMEVAERWRDTLGLGKGIILHSKDRTTQGFEQNRKVLKWN